MDAMSRLADALHGVPGAVAAFERRHSRERIVASSATKALRTNRRRPVERGLQWAGSIVLLALVVAYSVGRGLGWW